MTNKQKYFSMLLLIFIMNGASALFADDVDDYQSSWIHKALKMQRDFNADEPLKRVTFPATHNSYNAWAYASPVRYLDPNQHYSLIDQLRMDIREIELDVHYYFSMAGWPWEWKKKLLLSHGTGDHVGVSAFDRELAGGLQEIRNWIEQHAENNDLLIIDIEDHLDGHYDMASDAIEEYLGPWVYRPSGTAGLPLNVSKNEILDSGKKIIIFSSGSNDSLWRSWVFTRSGLKQSKPDGFSADPQLGGSFSQSDYDNYIIRIFEDRTNLSAMFSDPGSPITTELVGDMVRTGVNFISMDKLKPFDGRLEAAVWSWDANQPDSTGTACGVHKENGRFDDISCTYQYRFACKNDDGVWYITDEAGSYDQGEDICDSEAGAGFTFDIPAGGYDNENLKDEKINAGTDRVWIKYRKEESGSGSMIPVVPAAGCASEAYAAQDGNSPAGGGLMSLLIFLLFPSICIYWIRKKKRAAV